MLWPSGFEIVERHASLLPKTWGTASTVPLAKIVSSKHHVAVLASGGSIFPCCEDLMQADLCNKIAQELGFNLENGRLDVSVHPFTGGKPWSLVSQGGGGGA